MSSQRLWSPAFINYGVSSGIFYMTQYVLVAALPIILTAELGGTALDAGLAMTYFQIGTILCRPFAGRLIDGLDKRIILLISSVLFFIIMGLFNLTTSLQTIFVLRGIHGAIFALGTTVMAALAVVVLPASRKGEGINMFAVFSNIAMVLGWSISQFIEKRSLPWALMGLFIGFTYSGVLVFIPIELNSMGAGVWGSVFFALFALMIIISRPLVGKVYARYGSRFVIYPGVGLFIVGLAILGVVSTPVGIICTAPLLGLGYGAAQPAFQALAVQSAPIERAGVSTATYFLALDIAVGAGSVILALIANALGYQSLYQITSLIMIIALALYHFVIRKHSYIAE